MCNKSWPVLDCSLNTSLQSKITTKATDGRHDMTSFISWTLKLKINGYLLLGLATTFLLCLARGSFALGTSLRILLFGSLK